MPDVLPGTRPLEWPEVDQAAMADRLMDGAHSFVDRKMGEARSKRSRHWHPDFFAGPEAYEASIAANRESLKHLIGVVEDREVVLEHFGSDLNPALVVETDGYRVFQVRWQSVRDLWCEGLLVKPKQTPAGYAVVVPDADQTPEQQMGLQPGIAPEHRTARALAESGFMLLIPAPINRLPLDPGKMDIPESARERLAKRPDQSHREYLYRQSYHLGRHVIGWEVQHVLAAVEWLQGAGGPDARIGVAGFGEGGLVAYYAAAVDTRIQAVLVSGYFESREETWKEPVFRNVWGLLDQFGDGEIATLVAPRGLVVEHSPVAGFSDNKGRIQTPDDVSVRHEFDRIGSLLPDGFQSRFLIHGKDGTPVGPGSVKALQAFARLLEADEAGLKNIDNRVALLTDRRKAFDPADRHLRQFRQMEDHVQKLVRNSERVREAFFSHKILPELGDSRWSTVTTHPTLPAGSFAAATPPFREYFKEEVQGIFHDPLLPPNPRSRVLYRQDDWTGYDVVLDVFEDLVAWGVLLVPHDLRPGERRPVVVAQHGRNGLPERLIVEDNTAYRRVAASLVGQGYIVFVPHNLYRTESRYRFLNRKANTVKATLYSLIYHQHDQILRWLNTLDFVDGGRIAFYGNSFGGETALRVPPILEGYAVSISASFFNQWTRKIAGNNDEFSFLFSDEWETPVFNAGHTFDHAELAYLMVPRPFMVERGHYDHVAHNRWVAYEYAKVRRLYDLLDLSDNTEIEYFQGGHGMRQEGTLEFLSRHLNWPVDDQVR